MSPDDLKVSIIVPAFNEATRLEDRIVILRQAVASGAIDQRSSEVILVDDGSTDDTADVARLLLAPVFARLRILQLPRNSGKGAAIRAGTAVAAAPVVAFMDADMSVDPAQIPLLLAAIKDCDVVVGSRKASDSTIHSHRVHRFVMGRAFNLLANALTEVQLKDTQCGFKAFRTPVARILFHLMMTDRFAFDVEILSLARQLGLHITEVPVEWRDTGSSTVRPFADSMSMALDVCRMHWRKQRPQIPALEVKGDTVSTGFDQGRILIGGTSVFRQTDPILPLTEDQAVILLPLCRTDEIDGAAKRLSQPSTRLTVRQRLVSCGELSEMIPASFGLTTYRHRNSNNGHVPSRDLQERRHLGRTGAVREYAQSDFEPLPRIEV
jgi:dolichyl-phosphate beta-glucosyltransferase